MFDITKEVPSLELCKKLKELGFPQEGGGWYWDLEDRCLVLIWAEGVDNSLIKAPTCSELGEWIPDYIDIDGKRFVYRQTLRRKSKYGYYDKSPYWVGYADEHDMYDFIVGKEGKTEANTRTKMMLWLLKNKYLDFK